MDRREFTKDIMAASVCTGIGISEALPYEVVNSYGVVNISPDYTYVIAWQEDHEPIMTIDPVGRIKVDPRWYIRDILRLYPLGFASKEYKDELLSINNNGDLVAAVHRDGSVEFGPQFGGDDESKELWIEFGRELSLSVNRS
jgi:hypothetical protein